MKIILFIAAIFAGLTTSAQSLAEPFYRTEPFRAAVTPYGRSADAAQGDPSRSNYVAKLAEWSISEDGKEYSSSFAVPVWWLNRQVIVRVAHASSAYEVLVDGRTMGIATSGAAPVEFNVTKAATEGRRQLTIRLIDAEQNRINKLCREGAKPSVEGVSVICQPSIRIRDIVCSTTINDSGEGIAEFGLVVKCDALNPKRTRIGYTLYLNDTTVLARGYNDIALDMRREDTVRFMARLPQTALWSCQNPHQMTLDIESRMDNRIAECLRHKVGVRAADVADGKFYLNYQSQPLRLVDYNPAQSLDEQLATGANGVVVPMDYATEELLNMCDSRGVLVFVLAAIDTIPLGENIRRGGNPSNDPFWLNTYLAFNRAAYYTTHRHPCVVGYALAAGKTTGINVYESYLMLKTLEPRLPIIYEGAGGEWCSDNLTIR